MTLTRGARRCYNWLRTKRAGDSFPEQDILDASGWKKRSFETYVSKNKLGPFLLDLGSSQWKSLMDGSDISERYFDEVFTQTAPKTVTLIRGDKLHGGLGTYTLGEPLGKGAVGHVWSARLDGRSDVELVAVKVMLPREDLLDDTKLVNVRDRFRNESRNGTRLHNSRVVKYLDSGEVQQNPFLVMELARSSVGHVLKKSGPIPLEESAAIVEAVAEALLYLHSVKCTHRDVKPDNILMFDDGYKLGDLGIVRWTDFDPRLTTGATITKASMQLGSWFYMAPEQQQHPHNAVPQSDVYALGVTWIELLTGTVPSPQAVGAKQYPSPCDDPRVLDMLSRMTSYRPEERPELTEIHRLASELAQ